MYSSYICIYPLKTVRVLCPFLTGLFVLLLLDLKVLYRSWILIPSQLHSLQVFSSYSVSCHFLLLILFLCSVETSYLNIIPFIYFCFYCLCILGLFQEIFNCTNAFQSIPEDFSLVI